MSKELKFSENAREEIKKGIDIIANAVKVTLGPKGRNVIIHTNNGPHITKDGVTVARAIDLSNSFQNVGVQLIKEVASKTCNDVGDGTTTASVLAQNIINSGLHFVKQGYNPINIKKGIDLATKVVIDCIVENSIDVSNNINDIRNIATISANNDTELGNLIADAIEKITIDGVVTVEESKDTSTTVDIVEGMRFERGILSEHFITNHQKMIGELENPYIFITERKINNIQEILQILEDVANDNKNILLIASDYDDEVLTQLILNKHNGNLNVIAVKAPSFGVYRKDILQDLAILTNSYPLLNESPDDIKTLNITCLGRCDKVIVTREHTTIINGMGEKVNIQRRVEKLKNELEITESDTIKEMLKHRIAKLCGGVAIIKVGGSTEFEIKERKDRVDDAVAATFAAISEGVVLGGGKTYYNILQKYNTTNISEIHDIQLGFNILLNSLASPIAQIISNSGYEPNKIFENEEFENNSNIGYDAKNEKFCDLYKEGIIDPAKVSRLAIENAASIAGLFLTTECVIVPENNGRLIDITNM